MDVFSVKLKDQILVHQTYEIFRFCVTEVASEHAHCDLCGPAYFEKDGRPGCLEQTMEETVEIGEPWEIEQEGNADAGIEEGVVEVTIAAVEGEDITIYVKVPQGWGAVKVDDLTEGTSEGDRA